MSEDLHELRAADPVAGRPYRVDPAALVARVVATTAARPRPSGLFRVGLAGAASLAALLTAAGAAVIGTAPSLPTLALGGGAVVGAPVVGAPVVEAPVVAAAGVARSATSPSPIAPRWRPHADGLAPGPSLATAYEVAVPGPNLATTIALGTAFGVVGSIGGYNGTSFVETGIGGSRLTYDASLPVATWSYSAGTAAHLSVADLARLIGTRHWGYTVTLPATSGSAPVLVEGQSTQLRVAVTVRDGRVSAASGPAFLVVATRDYPLAAPARALSGAHADPSPTTPTSVAVRGAEVTLAPYTASGAGWLLPAYRYRGVTASGAPWRATAVAVAPRYLARAG